jgi:hypothetical protein
MKTTAVAAQTGGRETWRAVAGGIESVEVASNRTAQTWAGAPAPGVDGRDLARRTSRGWPSPRSTRVGCRTDAG